MSALTDTTTDSLSLHKQDTASQYVAGCTATRESISTKQVYRSSGSNAMTQTTATSTTSSTPTYALTTSVTSDTSIVCIILSALINTITVFQEASLAWSELISWVADNTLDLENEMNAAMQEDYETLVNENGGDHATSEDQQACTNTQYYYENALAPWQQMQSNYSTLLEQLSSSLSQVTSYISSVVGILEIFSTLMA